MRARRDLFPADPGLVARMVSVGLATPVVVAACMLGVLMWATWEIKGVVLLALGVGACVGMRERVAISSRGRRLSPSEAPELHAIVERLCVVADLPKPTLVLDRQVMPNSWIEGTKRGGFRLHLTQGLIDLLEPRE